MKKKFFNLFLGGSLILMLLMPTMGFADAFQQDGDAPPIRLKVATFRPMLGEAPRLPRALTLDGYPEETAGYYIVQFRGSVLQSWKDAVASTGAELLDYIPEFAFKVRMTPAQAREVEKISSVGWVGIFHPAYKLSPELFRSGRHIYRMRVERGASASAVEAQIAGLGIDFAQRDRRLILVGADASRLNAFAKLLDVAWVENFYLRETENEYGAGEILGSNAANANGYDGSTQIVAVADTGLGDGTALGAHPDIPANRIVAIYDWPGVSQGCWTVANDGPQDVDSGHGTHTSGSVLSDGGPNGEGKGTAPAAQLVFQATEDYVDFSRLCEWFYGYEDGYYLMGLPDDLRDLFQQAYDGGARVHSNSWGSDVAGEYTDDAVATDDFMWDHPNFLVTTSAGNAGLDDDKNGYIDEDSMGSPGTAKNILTVGASEHDRQGHYECDASLTYSNPDGDSCNSLGGMNEIFTYGEAWPEDYTKNPIASDPAAGNDEQMVAFSSRGPTDDGRIKPDVVAPGTYVLSNYSDLYQEGYDTSTNPRNGLYQYDGWGFPLNQYYKYMGGTSMSNPLVAGGAAVIRDFYQKEFGHSASAALVKATLINSAVDMLDENNDGSNDNDIPIPNQHEGWGRADIGNATDGSHQFEDIAPGLSTNGIATYQYTINSGGFFKVTLVWTDYPGSVAASKALVNDLDLVVTAPGGTVYKGNVFSGGWSQSGSSADRTNNVENVYVQSAGAGTWTVEVKGYSVPNGPQPFALVVDGIFGGAPPTNTPIPTTPTNTPTPTTSTDTPVPPTATDTPIQPTATDTPLPPTATDTPLPPTATDTPLPPTATDTPLPPTPTDTPVPPTPTNTPSGTTMHVGDLDGSSRWVWGSWIWSATVTIEAHNANHSPLASVTINGTWSGGYSGSGSCTTGSDGRCSISSGNIRRNQSNSTFRIDNLTYPAFTYVPADNHDPDGDSNGTSITVNKP